MANKIPSPSEIKNLADEIKQFLIDRHMWEDTRIYFNGVAYDSEAEEVLPDMDPHAYTEYAGDFLTMTFEGPLYDALNNGPWSTEEKLQDIFSKYGLYYEMGHAWDLSAYPLFQKPEEEDDP